MSETNRIKEVDDYLAEMKAARTAPVVCKMFVNAGAVEIAAGNSLKGVHEYYVRMMDESLMTASACWNGRRGAIRTGWGDGPVNIRVAGWMWKPPKGAKFAGHISLPVRASQMVLGDCGEVKATIPLHGDSRLLTLHWIGADLVLSGLALGPTSEKPND